MRIGVCSDSHLTEEDIAGSTPVFTRTKRICEENFNGVDQILHAGDVSGPVFINFLERIASVSVVKGNTDGGLLEKDDWPTIQTFQFDEVRVAMAHQRQDLYPLLAGNYDIYIFGHTHIAEVDSLEGKATWLNPGALKRPRGVDRRPSIAIIEIEGERYQVEILKF